MPTTPASVIPQPSAGLPDFVSQPPVLPQTIPSPAAYLPQFPFGAHPELLPKSPFLSYDFQNLRHHSLIHQTTTSSSTIPSNDSRLSPASSRPSSSSPPSQNNINSSIEINSTMDHSSDDSDDEQIDVVKSAFIPILRPTTKVEIADSTVQDKPIILETKIPIRQRCELKAPSSKKPIHETAPTGPKSPETKIKAITVQKSVWRPYWKKKVVVN